MQSPAPSDRRSLEEETISWLNSLNDPTAIPGLSETPDAFSRHLLDPRSPLDFGHASSSTSHYSSSDAPSPYERRDEEGYTSSSSEGSSAGRRRRVRARVELDPSQPLTAQGKPRARVFLACDQCRLRKNRCDGAKPICYNCSRRPADAESCTYGAAPKRRGRDKNPGLRRRVREQRAMEGSGTGGTTSTSRSGTPTSVQLQWHYEYMPANTPESSQPSVDDQVSAVASTSSTRRADDAQDVEATITPEPSMEYTRETWWDSLLSYYARDTGQVKSMALTLTTEQRQHTMRTIFQDIHALIRTAIYWTDFLHLPRFFRNLSDTEGRRGIQPSLLISMLALGVLFKSSEAEGGSAGRKRAMRLFDMAHSALQASLASGWVDIGLVQAAWFIAYFEVNVHPDQDPNRSDSALLLLDSLVRLFGLISLDADLIQPRATTFESAHGTLQTIRPTLLHEPLANNAHATINNQGPARGCNCAQYTVGTTMPSIMDVAPPWQGCLMWPSGLPEAEMRKEEARRLVWASVIMTASHSGHPVNVDDASHLFIEDPDNYALLFPTESVRRAGGQLQEDSFWSLHLRSMLLLHKCNRKSRDRTMDVHARAQFTLSAWLEIDAIEAALDQHRCFIERVTGYQARQMLFSSRMCIADDFQRYVPQITTNTNALFYREQAMAWLTLQKSITDGIWENLEMARSCAMPLIERRSVLIYWFCGHITMALQLFNSDPTLICALDAIKSAILPLEYLMRLWPCDNLRRGWSMVRANTVQACIKAKVPPPSSALPPPFHRRAVDPSMCFENFNPLPLKP